MRPETNPIDGDLATEEGCVLAATKMGEVVLRDLLEPVMDHTPPEMQARLFELFLMALTGAGCGLIGHELTQAALDAAKVGINDVLARRNAH